MSSAGTLYDETIRNGYMKLLTTLVGTGGVYFDFVSGISAAYDSYVWDLENLAVAGTAANLIMRVSYDSGASFQDAVYLAYGVASLRGNPALSGPIYMSAGIQADGWNGGFYLGGLYGGQEAATGNVLCGQVHLGTNPASPLHKHFTWKIANYAGPPNYTQTSIGGGCHGTTGFALSGVRFFFDTGGGITGNIRMYGRKTGA